MLKEYIEHQIKDYSDEKKLDLLTSFALGELFPYTDAEISEATEAIRESISQSGATLQGRRKKTHAVPDSLGPGEFDENPWFFQCDERDIEEKCRKAKEEYERENP